LAPVINGLEQNPEKIQSLVCVTAQHREMLDQVLTLFEIKPDYDLNIMVSEQDLFDVTCNVIHGLKPILEKERPDFVLVQGDTTTTVPMQKCEGPKVMHFLHERPLLLHILPWFNSIPKKKLFNLGNNVPKIIFPFFLFLTK